MGRLLPIFCAGAKVRLDKLMLICYNQDERKAMNYEGLPQKCYWTADNPRPTREHYFTHSVVSVDARPKK